MSDPVTERMDALTEAILRVRRRQDSIEGRLATIEEALSIKRVEPAPPVVEAAPPVIATPIEPAPIVESAEPMPVAARESEVVQPESRIGLSWVNRLGAVTMILAAGFFFKYAVDNEWIGEAGRVILGVLAGLGAAFAGDVLWRRGHRVYAQGISALGVSVLYLSFYAAFGFYHLIPPAVAFVLLVAATAMGGAMALRYDAPAIAALSLLGGYAAPPLLSTGQYRPWEFYSYLLVVNVAWITVLRRKSWRAVEAMAFAITVAMGAAFGADLRDPKGWVGTFAIVSQYAIFATSPMRLIFFLSQAIAAVSLAPVWEDQLGEFAVLSLAIAAMGLVISGRRDWPSGASIAFVAFWASFAMWRSEWYWEIPALRFLAFAIAAFALFSAWTPYRVMVRQAAVGRAELMLIAGNAIATFGAGYEFLEAGYQGWRGLYAVALGGVHLLLGRYFLAAVPEERRDRRLIVIAAGTALSLITLAIPIQFEGWRITMAWAIESAVLAWVAKRGGMDKLQWASIAVSVFAFFRLFDDTAMYEWPGTHPLIFNARMLTFVVSALSFWAAAWWWKNVQALPQYAGGHVVLLWALLIEATTWAWRTGDTEVSSVANVATTIVSAAYAAGLVALGVGTRTVLNRLLGLGLLGLVVAKLYFVDIWMLGKIYRVVALAGLGAMLLATSYLYSRYREKIHAFVKSEEVPGA